MNEDRFEKLVTGVALLPVEAFGLMILMGALHSFLPVAAIGYWTAFGIVFGIDALAATITKLRQAK
ncbi:hypothetical protein [Streptomyces sp. NRRL S-378]|uniref:hypothetical protein n=1 Tax=Streptomyces sp. NRRL S-378 TaxID=1463904 RepID=UPI0004C57944|nr:hypothetical protein [Streptomyces sp. NRRL S-378]